MSLSTKAESGGVYLTFLGDRALILDEEFLYIKGNKEKVLTGILMYAIQGPGSPKCIRTVHKVWNEDGTCTSGEENMKLVKLLLGPPTFDIPSDEE